MFRVGEYVRINEGRFYGRLGVIQSARGNCYGGTTYTVFVSGIGSADVDSVLPPTANNGD